MRQRVKRLKSLQYRRDCSVGLICEESVCAQICTLSDALAERLQRLMQHWAIDECISLRVERTQYAAPLESLDAQMLLLDIDSLEQSEQWRPDKKTGLIVISRDAGRAIRSYRWHPAALLKPDFDARHLAGALAACEKYWRRGRICLESPYRRSSFRLPLGSIQYAEASAHYTVIYQGRQSVRIRCAMNELASLLPEPPFVRCHRSYLVHLDAVESMTYTTLHLKDGTGLPLGRTYIHSLREALQAWREGE